MACHYSEILSYSVVYSGGCSRRAIIQRYCHTVLYIQEDVRGVPLFLDTVIQCCIFRRMFVACHYSEMSLQCMHDLSVVVRGSDFRPKSPFISEFKRDVSIVTMDH